MSVEIPGQRTWSIDDFQDFQHAKPKSPDPAGTPAFPDGFMNDLLAWASFLISSINGNASVAVAAAAAASTAAVTAQALVGVTPSLSSATYNAVLMPDAHGSGYELRQWTTITSAHGSTISDGSHRMAFNTSGGPFTLVQQGTAREFQTLEGLDLDRTFGANNLTIVFNASVVGNGSTDSAGTVTFDVSGDHFLAQVIGGKWRIM